MGFIAKRRDLHRVGVKCAENKVDVEQVERSTRNLPDVVAVRFYEEEFAYNGRTGQVDPHPASYTTIERITDEGYEDILTLPRVALRTTGKGAVRLTFIRKKGLPTTLKLRKVK